MVGRHDGKRRRRAKRQQIGGELQAVAPGHVEIEKGNVERSLLGKRQGLVGVGRF